MTNESITITSAEHNIYIYIYLHILITNKVPKMTKVTSQALYKKNIEIKEKKKKLDESSDDFQTLEGKVWKIVPYM